ncbi:DNA-J related domain-containing protein [Beggiatoa leptomitoformis]|uniref:DnaJ domain-containing protein n=1 Tax=Beggiatoa leptomitoformis TaxID=288004 RepID=A0A2N9YIV0_9GAMM|nr:DNA-J related domain-containing protein [Beggiatoa leptomitoformis]ALG67370.1 DnaJ domain-containing protein [Beggiatoa leptomitoformis]AUI70424.1 DnaJ domain-containing protein [Beggiatoa leptomitoformis]
MITEQLQPLAQVVLHQLQTHPQGIGEYELLKQLQRTNQTGFPSVALTEPLPLFQMHFLLFHVLYHLREQLYQEKTGELQINPLKIQIMPYQVGQNALTENDPLRDFYMDLSQLEKTTAEDVTTLLAKFWTRFHAIDKRQSALNTLGLQDPVDNETIKYRYRQLVMQHHPDRGGNTTTLQTLNAAMAVLEKST